MMRFISRAISAVAGLLILTLPLSSHAALFSDVPASAPTGLITTITLANTSASVAVPTNSVTPMFGHVFRKGDIASGCSGAAPIFRLDDGVTNVPFSESLRPVCWSDGSLKFAAFMLRVPNTGAGDAIPANGSVAIKIYTGGKTPSVSGRLLSDFASAGTDLNLSISAPDSTLSGTWVSDLNQGISAADSDNYQYMDGQAGAVWRVRASFRQSGANHGQLEAYWYVQALNDGSNYLAGVRYMVRIGQPWYDINTPAKNYRDLATMQVLNGASLVKDYLTGHYGTRNFTYSGSGSTFATAANNGLEPFQLAYLTCSVSCPTGLSSGTPYFIQASTSTTFTLISRAGFSTPITPTGSGSGTFAISTYPVITIFGSLFTADNNGKMEYVQAGGSVASDPTIQVKFNNTYWRSSRMLPPYDLGSGISPVPTGNNGMGLPFTYVPYTVNETTGFIRNVGSSGQSLEMSIMPPWAARHFYTQALQEEYDTRMIALSASLQPTWVKSSATGTYPCAITGTYASMGTCVPGFQFGGDVRHTHGFTYVDTVIPNGGFAGDVIDFSHWSANVSYALLATGEPEYFDIVGELANAAVWERGWPNTSAVLTADQQWMGGNRHSTINGTFYDPFMAWAGNLLRTDAWSMRDLEFGASMMPAVSYEGGANESQYFHDMAHTNYLAYNAFRSLLDAGTQDMGFWNEVPGNSSVNTSAFFLAAAGYGAQINEDKAGQVFYEYLAKWPVQFHTNHSMWNFNYYSGNNRYTSYNYRGSGNHYITDFAHFCIFTPSPTVTWTGGGHFTLVTGITGYTYQNDDKFIWEQNDTPTKPAGMSFDTPYFAVNFSGSNFDLSTTVGGNAITLTDTAASAVPTCTLPAHAPTTGNEGHAGTSSYQYLFGNAMNLGVANGFSVDSATLTDMNTRWQSYGGYVTDSNKQPTWAFSNTPY